MSNYLPEVRYHNKKAFITHFYSKADLMKIWGIQDHQQFERLIGNEGRKILGWRAGKQKFTPKQLRSLLHLIGKPITPEELTNMMK